MKRKLALFMAMLLTMALLCSTAFAAPNSPGRGDVEIDDPNVPLVEVPEVRIIVDADSNGVATVSESQILDAVQKVANGEAVRITVVAKNGTTITWTPKSIQALKTSGAEIMMVTDDGMAFLADSGLKSYEDGIALVIKKDREGISVYALNKGVKSYSWNGEPITLYVPVASGSFTVDSSYAVEQYDENGSKIGTFTGTCVEAEGQLWVVITISGDDLGYFVAKSGAVAMSTAAVSHTEVVSPLAAARMAEPEAPTLFASAQQWFDTAVRQFLQLFGM